jgi:type IV pilus assembly protein PilF
MMRGVVLTGGVWLCLLLGGCVTETSGPAPASDGVRVQAQLDLARGYLEESEFAQARRPLNRALEIDPRSVEAHVLLGVLNEREGDPQLAETSYRQALRIDPDDAQALNNYGSFLYSQGRYAEAVEPLRRLVRNPNYRARAQAYENLGVAELAIDERDRAREAFERSLNLNYAQARSSLELAQLAFDDGDYAVAQQYYEGFRTLARQNARSLCLGVKLGEVLNDPDQVASYRLALKNLYPDSMEARRCQVSP